MISLGICLSFFYIFSACEIKKKSTENTTTTSQESQISPSIKEHKLPSISGINHKGEAVDISKIKAKYILLEFWASWCPPCRQFSPELVSIYKEFQPKGFEILSISLDKDESKWKQAITQDNLYWSNHLCEFKGWESEWAMQFHIEEIPNSVLFDDKGNVIASHLSGEELRQKLSELLK